MRAYLAVMNEHRSPPESDPERWDETAEQSFAELRAKWQAGEG